MADTIYLEPNQIPSSLRGAYQGQKFKAVVVEETHIPADAGLWEGGSRSLYKAIDLATGREEVLPGQDTAPWDSSRTTRKIALKPGFAIVLHTIFCGKDLGLTFYVHPVNAAALLPAKAEISAHEKIVLVATRSFKSSYMGRDRYQMAREECEYNAERRAAFPTRAQWDAAKDSLIAGGYLNKAGAITTKGRNAA